MRRLVLPSLLLAAATLSGCDGGSSGGAARALRNDLSAEQLDTLAAALRATELDVALVRGGPFTLFAPTEQAFADLSPGTLDFLLQPANRALLEQILLYHAVDGLVDASVAVTLTEATTRGGDDVLVDLVDAELYVNEARVVETDLDVRGGLVHKIDTVLMPPMDLLGTLASRGFTTLAAAVQAAGLQDGLSGTSPLTVLAPTDAAFAALPTGVLDDLLLAANQAQLAELLTYHVLPGGVRASAAVGAELADAINGEPVLFSLDTVARVNGVTIETFNIPATNGVVHVIDAVLEVPQDIPSTASDLGFSTLVAALAAADLDDDLAGAGPFTVFAPSDAAFQALPTGLLDDLLLPANQPALIEVLLYHVVADELTASEVLGGTAFTTLQGDDIVPGLVNGMPMINASLIEATNVLASNGIVHAIDTVLLPPGFVAPAPRVREPATIVGDARRPLPADVVGLMRHNGPDALPGWAASASVFAGWDVLEASASPRRPDAPGSAAPDTRLVLDAPGSWTDAAGDLHLPLGGELRIVRTTDRVPSVVQLQVRGEVVTATLRYVDARGERVTLAPQSVSSLVEETVFVWQPAESGAALERLELAAELGSGSRLEAVRLLAQD